MLSVDSFKKPEYYFQPSLILKRIFKKFKGISIQKTPWNTSVEVDNHETIGKAIYDTRIYDLAVTEVLWRLIDVGNFVLDIGANIGFTVNISSYRAGGIGKVWAFEPNPLLASRLTKNIRYNKYQNTTLFKTALSDENKDGYLVLPDMYNNNEGVAFIGSEENEKKIKVSLQKLDDLLPPNALVHVLKIDVEGHELSVFKGAGNAIKNKLIKNIVFEDHNNYPSDVATLLLDNGYRIFRIEKGWFNIALKDPASASKVSGWEPTNYLATLDTAFVKMKMKGSFYKCI